MSPSDYGLALVVLAGWGGREWLFRWWRVVKKRWKT